jgi:hypothetical protein
MDNILMQKLKANSEAYDLNFELLLKTVGTPQHRKYIKEENRLEKIGIVLRDRLGLLAKDPCPIRSSKNCNECSHFIKRKVLRNRYGTKVVKLSEAKNYRFGYLCPFMNKEGQH